MTNKYKRYWIVFFLLVAVVSLYFGPYLNRYMYRDEGNWVYGVERLYNGEIVYRDFFEYIFPGIYFLLLLFYKLFGLNFTAARIPLFMALILAGFLIYLLSKRLKDSVWFGALCLLFYLSIILPGWDALSHHIFSVTASLLAIYAFCRFIESGYKRKNLIFCGLASALVPFFTQSTGAYVVIAGNVFLILHHLLISKCEASSLGSRLDIKRLIGQLGIYNLVIGLFFLPVLGFFYAHSALDDMTYHTFTWIMENYKLDTALSYFAEEIPIILMPLTHFSFSALVSSIKEIFIGYFQIIGFSLTLAYIGFKSLIKKEYIKSNAHYLLLFGAIGLAVFLASLSNPRDLQIRTMSIVGYMLFFYCCFEFLAIDHTKPRFALSNTIKVTLFSVVLLFLTTDLFYDNIGRSLAYYNNSYKVHTPRGTITADIKTGKHLEELYAIIEQYTAPGEDVFMYYHQSLLYFLFDRHNPTRFNTIDFYYTPGQMADAITSLKRSKPKIVFRDDFIRRRGHEVKFSTFFTPEQMRNNPVERYVKAHYRLIKNTGSVEIYVRVPVADDVYFSRQRFPRRSHKKTQ